MSDGICQTYAELEALAVTVTAQLGSGASDPGETATAVVREMIATGELRRCAHHEGRYILHNWKERILEAEDEARQRAALRSPAEDL